MQSHFGCCLYLVYMSRERQCHFGCCLYLVWMSRKKIGHFGCCLYLVYMSRERQGHFGCCLCLVWMWISHVTIFVCQSISGSPLSHLYVSDPRMTWLLSFANLTWHQQGDPHWFPCFLLMLCTIFVHDLSKVCHSGHQYTLFDHDPHYISHTLFDLVHIRSLNIHYLT